MAVAEEDDSSMDNNATRRASNIRIVVAASLEDEENLDSLSVAEQMNLLKINGQDDTAHRSSRHSHRSDLSALATHSGTNVQAMMMNDTDFNGSFDSNDSCASFASFDGSSNGGNGSKSSLNDSTGDLADAMAGFCQLDSDPVPPLAVNRRNQLLMNRTPSSTLVRTASMRCPTLQLIEEQLDE
mmetsp:Transcript_2292/g.4542  ORF Transcript_2292/g.4542 Transcript_2292/m.4542 type:complete len:184 (+) Transcript_2292:157-708(+)